MPHISDSNYHAGTTLSPPMCLSTCTLFLLITLHLFHYFPSLWGFFSAKPQGQALVADHWSSGWDSVLSPPRPDLNHWPGTETLLRAAAGRGHLRSESHSFHWELSDSFTLLLLNPHDTPRLHPIPNRAVLSQSRISSPSFTEKMKPLRC